VGDNPDGIQRSTSALPALDNEVGPTVRDSMEAPPWMQRFRYREVMAWLSKETDVHILKWSGLAGQFIAVSIAFVAGLSPRLWARHSRAGCDRRCVAASLRSTVACRAEVAPYAMVIPHRAGRWHPGEGDVMAGSGHSRSLPVEKLNDR
jgi:hypothetical protein